MEWRAGYSTYHNEALSTGQGLNTSTEVGIPGANYDEFSSGLSRIVLQNGFTEPMLGFCGSLPWDRGEDTYSVAGTLTKVAGNHTREGGHGSAAQRGLPAPDPGRGRSAGRVPVQRRPDRDPQRHAGDGRPRQRVRRVPAGRSLA